jgi:mono/diheme cytochrome c family protein
LIRRILIAAAVSGSVFVAQSRADSVDFAKQIRPIFSENCYKCHAGDKHKGGLLLDGAAGILKGGKDDPSVTPSDVAKSDLYTRVIADKDSDERMPPKGTMLAKAQTDLIKQWIAEGAKFGDWKMDVVVATTGPTTAATAMMEEQLPPIAAADPAAVANVVKAGALAMPIAQNTNFLDIGFQMGGANISDANLSSLAPVAQQVFWLNLAGTKVTDSGLAAVEPLTNLRKLHLERTQITDAALAHLKGLANLGYLNLYSTSITDAGVAQLAGLKNLKTIYLWQTKVTPSGAEELKKAIPGLTVNIGWDAAPAVAATTSPTTSPTTQPVPN